MRCPICDEKITVKELNEKKEDVGGYRKQHFWVCPKCDKLIFITSSAK